jgi:hypothetical protein
MKIDTATLGLTSEGARTPSQERFASERWQREFEKMNAQALAKGKVIQHAAIADTAQAKTAMDARAASSMARADAYADRARYEETPLVARQGAALAAGRQDATGGGGRIFDAAAGLSAALQVANPKGVAEPEKAEATVEAKLRAILDNMQALPALWARKNIHCEWTRDGLVVWVRNADVDGSIEHQLTGKLIDELGAGGLHPVRVYVNSRLSYPGGSGHLAATLINDPTKRGVK